MSYIRARWRRFPGSRPSRHPLAPFSACGRGDRDRCTVLPGKAAIPGKQCASRESYIVKKEKKMSFQPPTTTSKKKRHESKIQKVIYHVGNSSSGECQGGCYSFEWYHQPLSFFDIFFRFSEIHHRFILWSTCFSDTCNSPTPTIYVLVSLTCSKVHLLHSHNLFLDAYLTKTEFLHMILWKLDNFLTQKNTCFWHFWYIKKSVPLVDFRSQKITLDLWFSEFVGLAWTKYGEPFIFEKSFLSLVGPHSKIFLGIKMGVGQHGNDFVNCTVIFHEFATSRHNHLCNGVTGGQTLWRQISTRMITPSWKGNKIYVWCVHAFRATESIDRELRSIEPIRKFLLQCFLYYFWSFSASKDASRNRSIIFWCCCCCCCWWCCMCSRRTMFRAKRPSEHIHSMVVSRRSPTNPRGVDVVVVSTLSPMMPLSM